MGLARAVIQYLSGSLENLLHGDLDVRFRSDDSLSSDMTPLHHAVTIGWLDLAKALIAKGADVNARDGHGGTPLHRLFCSGVIPAATQIELVDSLVHAGCELSPLDSSGRSPLWRAGMHAHSNVLFHMRAQGARYVPLRTVVPTDLPDRIEWTKPTGRILLTAIIHTFEFLGSHQAGLPSYLLRDGRCGQLWIVDVQDLGKLGNCYCARKTSSDEAARLYGKSGRPVSGRVDR